MKRLTVSIVIPAYNEEANIEKLLSSLSRQQTNFCEIKEIYVVASGCTDKTVEKAREAARTIPALHGILRVLSEPERKGKAAAVNQYLEHANGDIAVICSADILPASDTIEQLCLPFQDETVGMTGAHPVPINSPKDFIGFCITTLWKLHHEVALKHPKCGELVAFRNIVKAIPIDSPVDEASIEKKIKTQGFKIAYAPNAIVQNKGPTSWHEFLKQRRRINYGHLWIKKQHGHKVTTGKPTNVLRPILKKISINPKKNLWLAGLILTELLAKALAKIDFQTKRKSYAVWERLDSTKKLFMKIGIVYAWYFPSIGGVEMYMKNLAEELEKLGHEVHIFTSDPHYKEKNHERYVHFIPDKKILRYQVPDKKALRKKLREHSLDLIHFNGPHPYMTAGAWYSRKLRVPSVATYHAHANPVSPFIKLVVFIEKLFYIFLFQRLIVTTRHFKNEAAKFYPERRIDVIPLGVHVKASEQPNKKILGKVLFVGGMDENHPYKGLEILLEAARQTPLIEYNIIGDGNRRKIFEQMAEKIQNVNFLGNIPASELWEQYRKADVLVLPSTSSSEGYGMVLLEAMASNTPVITTDKVGSHEEIAEACAGIIIPSSDPQKLAEAIEKVLNESELREKLIRNGRAFIRGRSWKRVAEQTVQSYGKIKA